MPNGRSEPDRVHPRGLVNVDTAAELLGVQVSTLYAWCEQERVPHVRLGRALRFDPDVLRRWIEEHSVYPEAR